MTNTQLELIISEETAKKMELLCKRRLLDLKMEESENPQTFIMTLKD